MNILVTGANGLVGSDLIEELVKEKNKVIGFVHSNPKKPIDGCIYERGNLEDWGQLFSLIKKHNIKHIVHSGAISHPLIGLNAPNTIISTNIIGTMNLLEAARLQEIKRFVYISSGAVYGNNNLSETKENDPCIPTSIYGVTKLSGEGLCRAYHNNYGLNYISLRLCYIYGPGRTKPDQLRDMLRLAIKGRKEIDLEGGNQKLEYLYIDDCTKAIKKALYEKNVQGEFNIGSSKNTSLKDVAEIIQNLYPNININLLQNELGYDMLAPFNCDKAKKLLDFFPEISLGEGIKKYAKWLESKKED